MIALARLRVRLGLALLGAEGRDRLAEEAVTPWRHRLAVAERETLTGLPPLTPLEALFIAEAAAILARPPMPAGSSGDKEVST